MQVCMQRGDCASPRWETPRTFYANGKEGALTGRPIAARLQTAPKETFGICRRAADELSQQQCLSMLGNVHSPACL